MSDLPPDPHDESLRAALRAEAEGTSAGPELLDRIRSASASRPAAGRRRAPWLLVAAAAVAAVALVATLIANDGGDDQRLDLVDDPSPEELFPELPTVACAPGEDVDLAVHLKPDSSAAEVSAVGEQLEMTGFAMRYVGRDETFERFQQLFAEDEELLATVTPEVLPTSYVLDLDQPADEAAVRAAVEGSSGVYEVVPVECEPTGSNMFDLLSSAFPCSEDGYQTVFYLSPNATTAEADAVQTALETDDRVRTVRLISADEIAAVLEAEAPEASWDPASIPSAYLAASDTQDDDLAIRGEISDLAGIIGTSSSDCTSPPTGSTGERPTQAVAVSDRGHVVVLDTASGDVIRDLGGFDDPTDPAVANREGGPYTITGIALHPNGQDVYFETCCEPASGAIFRVPIDGSVSIDSSQLRPIAYGYGIDISADGRWLAYASPIGIGLHDLETDLGVTAEIGRGDMVQVAVNHDGTAVTAERSLEYSASDPFRVVRSELTTFHRDSDTLTRGETTGGDVRLLPIYSNGGAQLTTVAARDGVIDLNVDVSGIWFLATPSDMPLRGYSEAADAQEILGSFTAADW